MNIFSRTNKKTKTSSYWYDQYDTDFDYLEEYGNWDKKQLSGIKKSHNLYKLSSVRRAISNFVQIVTQKNVPVTFASKSNSYTDGKSVVLSADVDDNFDVSVGLALHEGSHIVLSDFQLLEVLSNSYHQYQRIKRQIKEYNEEAEINGRKLPYDDTDSVNNAIDNTFRYEVPNSQNYLQFLNDIFLTTGKIGSKTEITDEIIETIKGLTNWVEDRRIDYHIFNSAPGYRDYYLSMYDHYFNDKSITSGIESDEFTDETIESYMFRIINLNNEKTTLNKLKGLKKIYQMLDLKNINRLKSSSDSMELALRIMEEILNNAEASNGEGKGKGEGEGSDVDGKDLDNVTLQLGEGSNNTEMGGTPNSMNITDVQGELSDENTKGNSKASKSKITFNKAALEKLKNKIKKQKDFLDGNIKKKTVTKTDLQKLDAIDESGSELIRVGNDYDSRYGVTKGVDCVVVKRMTESLIADEDFPFSRVSYKTGKPDRWAEDEVTKGIVLGNLLGKKLQIRGESRDTIFSRLKKGKIDRRMIASLGYDNDSVFYTNETDSYKKANLHISIDYSGSMQGDKLRKSIVSAVAITKACQMARNVNVQVSIRSTDSAYQPLPYIAVVYDSRRDSFKDFCKYMSILTANNTTPEGLCFEAIQKQLIPTDNGVDSYFLNLSDGQPAYSISTAGDSIQYSGREAAIHTNKQVKKMRANGINVLSYFITDYDSNFENSSDWAIFKQCYDKDAKYVNVQNMVQIAKTLNELFLKKS